MRFIERIRKSTSFPGTDRALSDHIDKTEEELFAAMPWILDLPEHRQNDLVEYIMKRNA